MENDTVLVVCTYNVLTPIRKDVRHLTIYMNHNANQRLYENKGPIPVQNQSVYREDRMRDLLSDQTKTMKQMEYDMKQMSKLLNRQNYRQARAWQSLHKDLNNLQSKLEIKETNEAHLEDQLFNLLNDNNLRTIQLQKTVETQTVVQEKLSKQLKDQKNRQDDVMKRLENQDALLEKVLRQLQFLRSIIFERSAHLIEKIESGYQLTSSYIYELVTGSKQPFSLFLLHQQESKQSHSNEQ